MEESRLDEKPESIQESSHDEKVSDGTQPSDEPTSAHIPRKTDQEDIEKGPSPAPIQHNDGQDPTETDPNIVGWDGPDDPEKPINWPSKRKWPNVVVISTLTFLTPLASSMFAPGVPDVMAEFHSDNLELSSFVVSIYILGYALGPLIISPLSELYGRLPLYHTNNVLFILFNVACAKSNGLAMLCVFRLLSGICGCTPLAIGSGTISDLFRQEERGKVMALWSMGPLLGPVIGPVAGSYLSNAKGWRWDFWVLAIAGGAIFIISLIVARETYAPVLLSRKVARLRRETNNPSLRAAGTSSTKSPRQVFWESIVRPTKMLFCLPIVFGLSLYIAVAYGYLYLIFTTITVVFEDQYGFSPSNVGLTYLGIGIGSFIGLAYCGIVSDALLKYLAKRSGGVELKPEYRLPPLLLGCITLPLGLFWYGWTAEHRLHWILPILGTTFLGLGIIVIFLPITTYLVDAYTVYAASAMAANTVLRSLGGAFLPLCGRQMYDSLGLGWGNSLLGFIALAMTPMILLLMKYGEAIRKHPRFQIEL